MKIEILCLMYKNLFRTNFIKTFFFTHSRMQPIQVHLESNFKKIALCQHVDGTLTRKFMQIKLSI